MTDSKPAQTFEALLVQQSLERELYRTFDAASAAEFEFYAAQEHYEEVRAACDVRLGEARVRLDAAVAALRASHAMSEAKT